MCLRGEGGQFLLARMDFQQPIVSVMEGEAMALLLGLHWVSSLGLQKVIFETDSKSLVVDRLSSSTIDHTELGDILFICKHLLRLNPQFKVHFCAHKLVKVAATIAYSLVYISWIVFSLGIAHGS